MAIFLSTVKCLYLVGIFIFIDIFGGKNKIRQNKRSQNTVSNTVTQCTIHGHIIIMLLSPKLFKVKENTS